MPAITSPFFNINYGWALGESGWNDGMDLNLQVLSFLAKGAVDSFVATLPPSPTIGQSVVLTTDQQIYVWFGVTWIFITPEQGQRITDLSSNNEYIFTTSWVQTASTASLQSQISQKANIASPVLTGSPKAPSPSYNTDDTSIATTESVTKAIGGRSVRVVNNISAMLALDKTVYSNVQTLGYYTPGDGGAGLYLYDSLDTTSASDGVTIFVGADGARRKLIHNGSVDILQAGAKPDGVTDCTANFQAAVLAAEAAGSTIGEITISKGVYYLTDTVTVNLIADDNSFTKANVVNFVGVGSGSVLLKFVPTSVKPLFSIVGAATNDSFAHHLHWRGFKIVGTVSSPASGIKANIAAYGKFEDIYTLALFGTHYEMIDTHTWTWDRCQMQQGGTGLRAYRNTASNPNAYTFTGCSAIQLDLYAIYVTGGSAISWYGGAIESNGKSVTATNPARTPVFLETPGAEGGVACTLSGVYIEGNKSTLGDIYVTMGTDPVTVNATACLFQKISPTDYVTNHITIAGGTATCKLNISGSAFKSYNGYVPDVSRKVLNITSTGPTQYIDDGVLYQNSVERPTRLTPATHAMVVFDGTNGVIGRSNGNVTSVTRVSTGVYDINLTLPGQAPYIVSGSSNDNIVIQKTTESATTIRVTTLKAGVATDTTQVSLVIWG